MNKNLRPYVISIDWLQLHLHRPSHFSADAPEVRSLFAKPEDVNRFSFSSLGHGSKTYRDIWLVSQRGIEWAELSANPYSASINPLSCTLRIKNKPLYEPGLMADIADFISLLGFKFVGLSRLDLAYDFNELYGGLTAEHFMKKYEKGDIIKFGAGNGYRQFQQGYCLGWNKADKAFTLTADIAIEKKISDDPAHPTEYEKEIERQKVYESADCLISLPDERNPLKGGRPITEKSTPIVYTSTTWGSRSSGHQVQLYNKTAEMQQVAYKHHIAQRWRAYGLDLSRDVWRLEIRITKGAKLLENQISGERHLLNPADLITEEQIEQLFWDYSYKYFRFYTLDPRDKRTASKNKTRNLVAMLQHKDRLQQYRLFCCAQRNAKGELTESLTHVFVPRCASPQKDYTRSIKQAINLLEGAVKSQAIASDPGIVHTQETLRHLSRVYGIEKRELYAEKEFRARANMAKDDYDIFTWYRNKWADVEDKWFVRSRESCSALAWGRILARSNQQLVSDLADLGFEVLPMYADIAIEELLDNGTISDAWLAKPSINSFDGVPFDFTETEIPPPF